MTNVFESFWKTNCLVKSNSDSYSLLNFDPVVESLRFQVLKRDRVCQLYEAGLKDEALEVDHIVPRSKEDIYAPDDLQVVCARCNRGKSNRYQTDFRENSG